MDIYLRLIVDGGKATFAYSLNGKTYKAAGEQFTMREGKWVGAKVGLYAIDNNEKSDAGLLDADWFRIGKK